MRSEITLVKGTNTYEVGNVFSLNWYYQTPLEFTVLEFIDDLYFKKIVWRICAEQWNLSYNYMYELHYNTVHKNTLLNFSLIYDDPESLPFTKVTLGDSHRIVLETCELYKKYLEENRQIKEQLESIVIKCDRKKIWQILINLNKLYRFNTKNIHLFEYEGEHLEKNSLIKMIVEEEFIETFTVKNIVNSPAEEKWGFELENFKKRIDEENKGNCTIVPKQRVIFSLFEVSENKNFLVINHVFRDKVKKKDLKKLSKDKVVILTNLKTHLENNMEIQ